MKISHPEASLALHKIIKRIWDNGPVSRAELGRLSGYSRSTITVNCDQLLSAGIICEEPPKHNNSRTKKRKLYIPSDIGIIVGVEMGARSCDIGLCTIFGKTIISKNLPLDYSLGPNIILDCIKNTIMRLVDKSPNQSKKILGIGIGLPSPVDYQEGYAVHPAFMPGWHKFPIKKILEDFFSCKVFVDNECNTMALGESFLSKKYRKENILFIKAGTGIGAGIIIHGNIYRGNSGLGGNIGHIHLDGRSERCKCGKTGCLEAVVGGDAISQKANAIAQVSENSYLYHLQQTGLQLSPVHVKKAADMGDRESINLIKESAEILGETIGKLVVFFDPKAVIIGGGLTGFGPQYVSYIRQSIISQSSPWIKSDFEVKKTKFGDSVGIIGSAMLCIKELLAQGMLFSILSNDNDDAQAAKHPILQN